MNGMTFKGYSSEDNNALILFKLFILRFRQWLEGSGHPPELIGTIVDHEAYQASLQDQAGFRPRLFWKAICDYGVLPVTSFKQASVGCFCL